MRRSTRPTGPQAAPAFGITCARASPAARPGAPLVGGADRRLRSRATGRRRRRRTCPRPMRLAARRGTSTTSATSSTVPKPTPWQLALDEGGHSFGIVPSAAPSCRRGKASSPGATLNTRIPSAREAARHRLREADLRRLGDVVAWRFLPPPRPQIDATIAIMPPPAPASTGRAARETVERRDNVPAEHLPSGRPRPCPSIVRAPEPPTLLTTMSSPPNFSTAAATTRRPPRGSSRRRRRRARGRALALSTAASSASAPRAQKTTSRPPRTSRVAIPRPIPRLEPVTSATLPASPRSTGLA